MCIWHQAQLGPWGDPAAGRLEVSPGFRKTLLGLHTLWFCTVLGITPLLLHRFPRAVLPSLHCLLQHLCAAHILGAGAQPFQRLCSPLLHLQHTSSPAHFILLLTDCPHLLLYHLFTKTHPLHSFPAHESHTLSRVFSCIKWQDHTDCWGRGHMLTWRRHPSPSTLALRWTTQSKLNAVFVARSSFTPQLV